MQILFADETDRQEGRQGRVFFSICSLTVSHERLMGLEKGLESVKNKYNLKNLKDLRKKVKGKERRLEVCTEISQMLQRFDAKARAIVIGPKGLKEMPLIDDLYMESFKFLLERWQMTLNKSKDFGTVIFDTVENKLSKNFRNKFNKYIQTHEVHYRPAEKSYGFSRDHIYPTLLVSDDEHSNILQAADDIGSTLNAVIASHYFEEILMSRFDVEKFYERNEFLNVYWSNFMKSSSENKIDGYGIKIWY